MKKNCMLFVLLFVAFLGGAQTTGEVSTDITVLKPEMVDQSERWLSKMPQVLQDARASFINDGYLSYEDIQNGVEQVYLDKDHVGIFIRAHSSAVTSELLEISSGQTLFKYKGKYIYPYCLNEFADLRPAVQYIPSAPKVVDPIYCSDSIVVQIVDKCYGEDGETVSEVRVIPQDKPHDCGKIIYILGVNVLPVYNYPPQNFSFTEGDSIEVNNIWYKNDTLIVDSLQTTAGCDSIVTTKITSSKQQVAPCTRSLNEYEQLGRLDVGASLSYGGIPMAADYITNVMFRPGINGIYRIPVITKKPCLVHEVRISGSLLTNSDHEVYHPSACGCKNVGESGNIIITGNAMWTTSYIGWMGKENDEGAWERSDTPFILTGGVGLEGKYHQINLVDTDDFMFYPVAMVEGRLYFSNNRNKGNAYVLGRITSQFTETVSLLGSIGVGITLL